MRSAADGRARAELVLRALALAGLVFALVAAIRAGRAMTGAPLQVAAATVMEPRLRDSLTALARAGTPVRWGGTVAPLAATSEPVRDPSGRTRITVAADAPVTLGDSLGGIDSLDAAGTLTTAGLAGVVQVGTPQGAARTLPRLAPAMGRVLVLGRVGWEAKFTVAALEEAGWRVDTRLRVADTLRVTQGIVTAPSVATHAAIVVLDSTLDLSVAAIAGFVRAGGGLVLAGDGANALPALTPRGSGAVVVPPRDSAPEIVVHRVSAGRVAQVRDDETWRWRMQGEGDAVAGHRAFWNDLVAMVASAPRDSAVRAGVAATERAASLDEAPLAALVHQLGPPSPDAPASPPPNRSIPAWLGALVLLLLLAEWGSRRARGAA